VQVFGGTGYMVETGIEKLMRDAKYCQLFPEPNWVAHDEMMRIERAGRGAARAK
jgi:alkylation response protein AidB-like acyl-CoA dehydrogenase